MSKKIFVLMVCAYALTSSHTVAAATKTLTKPVATATTTLHTNRDVEQKVRDFFKDTPVMAEVARCESDFRQFSESGTPLRSSGMIGVFQFYESIHTSLAKAHGFDLTTLDGNLGYAKYVYDTEGTTPWNGSRYCWDIPTTFTTPKKVPTTAATITTSDRAKLLEQIATLTKLIATLQKQLAAQTVHKK